VSEHAPEHPVVYELVSSLAQGRARTGVPPEAISAAREAAIEVDVDLDGMYAEAASSASQLEVIDAESLDIAEVIEAANTAAVPAAAPAAAAAAAPAAAAVPAAAPAAVPAAAAAAAPKTKPLAKIAPIKVPAIPSLKRAEPVLAALRTPDRPALPPKPADPPDAKVRAQRIAIAIDVRLHPENRPRVDAHSRDLSTSGLFVVTDAVLTVGATLRIDLLLPGKEAFTEDEHVARATVARRGEGGYGLSLVDPDPALVTALAALR